ncbi:MAG: hypothetical protein ACM34K_20440 [Bacillota bacterium]
MIRAGKYSCCKEIHVHFKIEEITLPGKNSGSLKDKKKGNQVFCQSRILIYENTEE